jgi:hypothetical protein
MQKFQDVVIDPAGNALAGVTVRVLNFADNLPATLYSDNAKTPLTNPLTTDANGHFFFYAEQGRYNLDMLGGGVLPKIVSDIWLDDVIYARLASPVFTGNPTAPTPVSTDNSKSVATTEFTAGMMSAHTSAADPHPIYLTKAEVDFRAGGSVTQLTSKTTPVSLNKNTGEIITAADTIPKGTSVAFNFNNLTIDPHDNVVVNIKAGSAYSGVYLVWAENITDNKCDIVIHNFGSGDLAEVLKIQYTVIKGAIV